VSATAAMKHLQKISLPTPQSEHYVKNHYMSVNSNPTLSQQNLKKSFLSQHFSRLSPVPFTPAITI
jgi:hypothetical protein